MTKNRTKLARERSGLSVGQACKLLELERDELLRIEEADTWYDAVHPSTIRAMIDIYSVKPEWMAGECEQHDYEKLKTIKGAETLSDHDRDIIAEFVAAMPTRKSKTLAEIAAEKSKS